MDTINALEDSGWLKTDHDWLSMHPVLREYIQSWPWQDEENYLASAEAFMGRLYELIKPEGKGNDSVKQFPEDYTRLWHLLRLAEQMVVNLGIMTPASQRLSYHLVMDAPVDQDEWMLRRCLALLRHPDHLDPDSVLRLYNEAAILFRRFNYFDDALDTLKEMKAYLIRHPGAYYWSVYHNTTGNILHDMDAEKNLRRCMKQQDEAIAAAKLSRHPGAQKLLATCLMDKAMTLIDLGTDLKACGRLLDDAADIIRKISADYDYERYHWLCIAAMYHVKATGDPEKALHCLEEATRIADTSRDSAMAYADHLLDQCAPIYYEMGRVDKAVEVIREAIRLCEENMEIATYRRLRFEAYYFSRKSTQIPGIISRPRQYTTCLNPVAPIRPMSLTNRNPFAHSQFETRPQNNESKTEHGIPKAGVERGPGFLLHRQNQTGKCALYTETKPEERGLQHGAQDSEERGRRGRTAGRAGIGADRLPAADHRLWARSFQPHDGAGLPAGHPAGKALHQLRSGK